MIKRWRWHIVIFIGVYLVWLVALLPAALALQWAEPSLAKMSPLQLRGLTGTVWTGRAAQIDYKGLSLGELSWDVSPWALLAGRINVDLQLTNSDNYLAAELSSGLGMSEINLQTVNGQLSAELLKRFAPAVPLTPTGRFALNLDEVEIKSGKLHSLVGRVVWNKGGVSAPLALELGDLVAEFGRVENGVAGHVKDSGGPLQLEADLQLGVDGSYTLTGKSAARPGAAPALATSLTLLGKPDAQGKIPFRYSGRL